MQKGFFILSALSLLFTQSFSFISYATENKITNVNIEIIEDKEDMEAGEPYPAEIVVSDYSYYELLESEWQTDYDLWKYGKEIKVKVVLAIKDEYSDEYEFDRIEGYCTGGKVLSASCNGETAILKISYIPKMKLLPPENVGWWSDRAGVAVWDKVKGAAYYSVDVYIDGEYYKGYTTYTNSINLTACIANNFDKDVTYTVKAIADWGSGDDSEYVQCTDSPVGGDTTFDGTVNYDDYSGISAKDEEGESITGWQKILGKWYYFDQYGNSLKGWQYINNFWYYFDKTGLMLTGWEKSSDGIWYYLTSSGAMATGWLETGPGGTWYYFNASGGMVTGWNFINETWYYFDESGKMLFNALTPDGFQVDTMGRWIDHER